MTGNQYIHNNHDSRSAALLGCFFCSCCFLILIFPLFFFPLFLLPLKKAAYSSLRIFMREISLCDHF